MLQAADDSSASPVSAPDALRIDTPDAQRDLLDAVYHDLRRVAHRALEGEATGHTLSTTALVHETYLRLAGQRAGWENRAHFFAIAARTMRHILVDHARRHAAMRRGGPERRAVSLDAFDLAAPARSDELLALDEALERLAVHDKRLAQVVECRFFGGLSEEETAATLGLSVRTVSRDWRIARGWLRQELRGDG